MKSVIGAISLLASLTFAKKMSLQETSCTIYEDFSTWDLRPLQAQDVNGTTTYYTNGKITWNACQFIDFANTKDAKLVSDQFPVTPETFAYLNVNGMIYPLTEGTRPDSNKAQKDGNGTLIGIEYLYESNTPCVYDKVGGSKFKFRNTVMCNEKITGKGNASIKSVTGTETCSPTIVMEHESGCYVYSMGGFVKFMENNVWLSGTLLIVFGLLLVLFGRKFFPYIMGVFGALTGFAVTMYFASIFQWLGQTWSLVLMICVAVILGLLLGFVLFKFTPIAIGFVGVAAGVFAGCVAFSFILALSGYNAIWLLITLCAVFGIIFGFLAFKFRHGFLSLCTALIGGYMFMRGWTMYFGHYPSEAEQFSALVNDIPIELGWQYWVYISVFAATAVFGFVWQVCIYSHHDKKMEDYYEKKDD